MEFHFGIRTKEKALYFIIAHPQKIVLVKTGNKNDEKRFLGYEFSNRRGSEGIHPIQRSKSIDECTQLYDANTFTNPDKASTYIYSAFNNKLDLDIAENLQHNISYHSVVDLLTFDRVDFEKNISLSAKKKVVIKSKWEITKLGNVVDILDEKRIPVSKRDRKSGDYPYYGATGVIDYIDKYIFDEKLVLIGEDGAKWGANENSAFSVDGKYWVNNHAHVLKPNRDLILDEFLIAILNNFDLSYYITGMNVPKLNQGNLKEIKIPLPTINIQKKIVIELDKLEEQKQRALEDIENLREDIHKTVRNSKSRLTKLEDITTKIGSGATPKGGKGSYQESGISLIRSQNIYDYGFVEKGLAFINEEQAKKLDNVTVEKNDILFNITGASIARCCIVEDKYLPARVNQHVSIIRINDKSLPKYVHSILISEEYKQNLLAIGDGGTSRQAITKLQLEEFKIPLPTITEQKKIVASIEKIEKKIAVLKEKIKGIPSKKEIVLKKYLE